MESNGFVNGAPRLLLRLEGAAMLVAALLIYHQGPHGWLLFVILILAPDLSALGYLAGPKTGAACYNAAHSYLPPFVLCGWALFAGLPLLLSLGLIWVAHIGADRMLGYGLKYPTGFSDTHLGPIGRAREAARH